MIFSKKSIYILFIYIFIIGLVLFVSSSSSSTAKIKSQDKYFNNFTPQDNYDLSTTDSIDPTTWVAVDNLGRSVSNSGETYTNGVTNTSKTVATTINKEKQVGLFYHNWHNVVRHNMTTPETIPARMSYISSLNKNPLLIQSWKETSNNGHPGLGTYWWGEPVYGFYNPKDKYVIRKQIELIADAGVDFLVLDYTNYNTISAGDPYSTVIDNSMYPDELNILFQVLDEAKADGIKTPKVTFMLSHLACDRAKTGCDDYENNEHTKQMVQWLFANVYNNSNRQKHLLYGGGNLPIILAQHPSSTTWQPDSAYTNIIKESSAHWRYMGNQYENAAYNTSGYDWSWIDKYPQTKYMYNTSTGTTNEITVSPAQHTDKDPSHGAIAFSFADTYGNDLLGRSNAVGDEYSYSYQYRGTTYNVGQSFQIVSGTGVGTLYGRNFQQQWDYAISTNPEFVMVTGWNEYLAGSFADGNGKIMFVDQYNDEYSRDIEPVKGSLKDSYYYQLVSNIRRYKGANNQTSQSTSKTINIYGDPNQWNDSNLIDYNSYTNNYSPDRNVNNNQWGYNNNTKLTNVGVKNDIRTTKVSYDASNIYFYVETVNTISDISKLRLLIDTLPSKTNTSDKNWNEFEFVLNRNGKTADTIKLEKVSTGCRNVALPSENNGNCQWTSVGNVNYQVVSNTLQVSIPRSYLGLTSSSINFNYKWADNNMGNLEKTFDIMSVYTDGDAAPGGRFAYKFSGNKVYEEPTDISLADKTLNSGTYGTAYTSNAFDPATDGTGSYTYKITSGAPSGATINSTNRTIKFPATTPAGTYNVVVRAIDDNSGKTDTATMKIVINKRSITVTAGSSSKTYDGSALTNNTCNVTSGTLVNGHTVSCTMTSGSTVTNVADSPVINTISTYTIKDKSNNDVKTNYNVILKTGTLTIKEAVVVKTKVAYTTHVQNIGWQKYVRDGAMAGTSGKSLRLEGIKIKLENQGYEGNILYKTHVQNEGWESSYKKNDEISGTQGKSYRLEAIKIKLTGSIKDYYDVYYRVHAENFGWLGWARNDEEAGTAGYSYRLEGIEIKLVPKGENFTEYGKKEAFKDKNAAPKDKLVGYTTHVQNIGWQKYVYDGAMAGTSGKSLRLEGIKIKLENQKYDGNILYRTHIQNIGWEKSFKKNNEMSGTEGKSYRLEGIEIKLDGGMKEHYDIYYRVHAENFGWLGWAKNGESAGTAGYSYRLEGIEIKLVPKDQSFSDYGKTKAFRKKK